MHSISFLPWIFDLAVEDDAWPGLPHYFLRFGLSQWIHFSSPITIRCKKPFRFCLWSSYPHVKKRPLTSLGLSSCGTQYPCFCTMPIALRRFKIACWVTPKILASSFEFGMNLDPIMTQLSVFILYWPPFAFFVTSVKIATLERRNQYSYVFIDGACFPHALHSNRCPSTALFFKLKQKSSAPANVVLLAQKLTWLEHKEGVFFTLQRNNTYWLLEGNGDVLTWI